MTQQSNRRISKIVVESTLTRSMYARILLLLGVRSWGFVIMAAVFLYLIWWSIDIGSYTLLAIYAGLLVLIYGGAVLVSVVTKRNRRAYFPVKYTFEESGITKETASVRQSFKWSSFARWRKIGPYFLIYASKRSFFVIPESRIPREQITWFESLLNRNIVKRSSRSVRK
jgi:hypothetical protein